MLKTLFKDSIIYGFTDACFKAIALFTFPIYANFFSVTEYGIIELAVTLAAFSSIFYIGIHNAIQRFYLDPNYDKSKQIELVSTGIFLLISIVAIISFSFLSVLFPFKDFLMCNYHLKWEFIVLSIIGIFPSQLCLYSQCILRLYFAPWKYTAFSAVFNGLNVIFSLYLAIYLHMGIRGYLIGNLLATSVVVPLALWFIRFDLSFTFDLRLAKEIISFGYPFIFTAVAYWLFAGMDRWMLGLYSTIHEVGLYSVAFKMSCIMTMVRTAFGLAWSPYALKLYKSEENYKNIFSRVFTIWYFILVIAQTIVSFFSLEFFQFTTPAEYWSVSPIIVFLVAGLVFYGLTDVSAIGITIKKKTLFLTQGAWISASFNLILNFILIPPLGAMGAALATLTSYFILFLFYSYKSQQIHPLSLEVKKISIITLIFICSVCLSYYYSSLPVNEFQIRVKIAYLLIIIMIASFFEIFPLPRSLNFWNKLDQFRTQILLNAKN